jgi:uncharacterized cupin superfamily protein
MARGSKVFRPADLSESNPSSNPEPFREGQRKRYTRRLGDHAGLKNYGVNLVRVLPDGQSSARHTHSKQDEFVYVIEGEIVLVTDAGRETVGPGTCIGFPAGTGDGHHFLNLTQKDAILLVTGDRTAGDEVTYPDIDLQLKAGPDGVRCFRRKDGTPYPRAARGYATTVSEIPLSISWFAIGVTHQVVLPLAARAVKNVAWWAFWKIIGNAGSRPQ